MYNDIMEHINSEHLKILPENVNQYNHFDEMIYAFIKWGSDETCSKLVELIKELTKTNYSTNFKKNPNYTLYYAFVNSGYKNELYQWTTILRNFFYVITEATLLYEPFKIDNIALGYREFHYTKEYIQNIVEPLVIIACECKKILYWYNINDETTLTCYRFDKLLDARSKHTLYRKRFKIRNEITKTKSKLLLMKGNDEIEIEGVNTISQNPKKNRFITMYKAFSDAIDKNIYCPWCNPDETLEYHCRCNECEELIKFFVPETDDNIKEYKKERNKFNTYLKRQEVKNDLTATIKKRGIYLLDKLEKLKESSKKNNNNEEMLQFYERVKKIIEKRFKV